MRNITGWLATAAAAAVSLGWVGTVQAKASASASFGPLRITLLDLNLTDGIAPAITFAGGSSFGNVSIYDAVSSLYPSETADGVSAFQPLSVAAATPHGTASARVTGAGGVAGAGFDVSGQIFGDGVTGNGMFSTANAAGNFSLTPWTVVTFDSPDATVAARTTVGSDGAMQELALATVMFSVEVYHPGSSETHQSIRNTLASAISTCDPDTGECTYVGESNSIGGALGVSYANLSALDSTGRFFAVAAVDGGSPFAVPEPETYAMMLTGLGLVGIATRRRQRN